MAALSPLSEWPSGPKGPIASADRSYSVTSMRACDGVSTRKDTATVALSMAAAVSGAATTLARRSIKGRRWLFASKARQVDEFVTSSAHRRH